MSLQFYVIIVCIIKKLLYSIYSTIDLLET